MIAYPNIDPVIFSIGPIMIRWYGMAYLLGIVLGVLAIKSPLQKKYPLSTDDLLNFMSYIMIGIILGGRLGYVLIYDPVYYLSNPSQILAIWNGGMAYHGGAFGAMVGVGLFARRHQIPILGLLDFLAVGSTVGIFFGRIANFINAELVGRVTDMPWGMVFPGAGDLPRHPSQLYEAGLEGLLIFCLLYPLLQRASLKDGQLFSLYLMLYACARFIVEFFREPDAHLGFIVSWLSMGQVLSVIMLTLGVVLWRYSKKSLL